MYIYSNFIFKLLKLKKKHIFPDYAYLIKNIKIFPKLINVILRMITIVMIHLVIEIAKAEVENVMMVKNFMVLVIIKYPDLNYKQNVGQVVR